MEQKTCKHCNETFRSTNKNFCCKYCAKSFSKGLESVDYKKRDASRAKLKTCQNCGGGFDSHAKSFCSKTCYIEASKGVPRPDQKGRKQSKETIAKRINNTDQKAKEAKRKQTMLDRYGVENYSQTPEGRKAISERGIGVPRPRTAEHQQKIIDSKRANGTLKHSKETGRKLSEALLKHYARTDIDFSYLVTSRNNTYVNGYYGDMYYRSSYEKDFLEFCDYYGLKVVSAENNEHVVPYTDRSGKSRRYYPDFFLPEIGYTVEVKPTSMLDVNNNDRKIDSACSSVNNYIVLTEADGICGSKVEWHHMYEENFRYLIDGLT